MRAFELLDTAEVIGHIDPEKARRYRETLEKSLGGIKPSWLHYEPETDRIFIYDDERF